MQQHSDIYSWSQYKYFEKHRQQLEHMPKLHLCLIIIHLYESSLRFNVDLLFHNPQQPTLIASAEFHVCFKSTSSESNLSESKVHKHFYTKTCHPTYASIFNVFSAAYTVVKAAQSSDQGQPLGGIITSELAAI